MELDHDTFEVLAEQKRKAVDTFFKKTAKRQ